MRNLLYSLVFLSCSILVGCGSTLNESDLKLINGYWEIEKVEMPDGEIKDYTINTTLDYFEINEKGEGFRQKVMPQFNGEYETNGVQEKVVIVKDGDTYWMDYSTDYASWKEELIRLEDGQFVVKNTHDITYFYKRSIPIELK